MTLNPQLRDLAQSFGADFFGVASLAPAYDFVLAQGGPLLADYARAVSIGIALPHAVVDQLPRRAERAAAASYRRHGYDIINGRLDLVASRLGGLLDGMGFKALPIAASQQVDDERLCGRFSHKLAAHLAGLGWIGKNCMLITPERGPRVRWATVLTDAPLEATGKAAEPRCGTCVECVTICPVGAYTGQPFRPEEPREARFDAAKCDRYFDELRDGEIGLAVCGMCLYICPYGRR
jgi:epoxyqueuosine reductase QueG